MVQAAVQARAGTLVADEAPALALPAGYGELRRILEDPNGSSLQMSRALAAHGQLARSLVALLGGPLHRLPSGEWNLERAVNQLGMQRVVDLALVVSLPATLRPLGAALEVVDFWRLARRAALCARRIADASGGSERDRMFATALLMPTGLALLAHLDPAAMNAVERTSIGHPDERIRQERRLLGTDHILVAAALARHWQLPAPMVRALSACDEPARAVPHHREAAILKITRSLCGFPGSPEQPDALALDMLRLDAGRLAGVAVEVEQQEDSLSRLLPGRDA